MTSLSFMIIHISETLGSLSSLMPLRSSDSTTLCSACMTGGLFANDWKTSSVYSSGKLNFGFFDSVAYSRLSNGRSLIHIIGATAMYDCRIHLLQRRVLMMDDCITVRSDILRRRRTSLRWKRRDRHYKFGSQFRFQPDAH